MTGINSQNRIKLDDDLGNLENKKSSKIIDN